jgi:PAS domain S-box-containing protein
MPRSLDPQESRSHQAALTRRLALYERMVEALDGCVLCVDHHGIISFANRCAGQLLGGAGADLVGSSFLTLHDTRDRAEVAEALRSVLEHSGNELETRHQRADGVRTVRWTLTPLHGGGLTVLAIGIDVTRRLEREQRNAEDDAMAVMGALVTGFAHEIRNPLNAANLQLELLLSRAERAGDAQLTARLGGPANLVGSAIGRLSVMLDEFLHAARPREPVRSACSVAELFESVLTLQRALAESVGICLHSHVREQGLQARCDREMITQVLTNLVRNSVDALGTQRGGTVLLHAERRIDGGVCISVLDDGRGLAQSMLGEAAFAPFSTTKAAGTGLGLSVARKIVSQHGGTIELLARPGAGTAARFWISV